MQNVLPTGIGRQVLRRVPAQQTPYLITLTGNVIRPTGVSYAALPRIS